MTEIRIDVTELKPEGDEVINGLVEFLREKTGMEVEAATNEIRVKGEEGFSKRYLRVLLRKYLHKAELKDYFKVISGGENTLTIKERKIPEE